MFAVGVSSEAPIRVSQSPLSAIPPLKSLLANEDPLCGVNFLEIASGGCGDWLAGQGWLVGGGADRGRFRGAFRPRWAEGADEGRSGRGGAEVGRRGAAEALTWEPGGSEYPEAGYRGEFWFIALREGELDFSAAARKG